jgi:hypothetical protein
MASILVHTHGAVLVTAGVVLFHAVEKDENGDEDLDGVWVTTESHVGEADVVVSGDLCSSGLEPASTWR